MNNFKNNWITTYSGKKVHPFDIKESEIDINDIAHSLSLTCRFNGHMEEFYSVAEHSIRVASLFEIQLNNVLLPRFDKKLLLLGKLKALLHDAAEAYVSDVPSPLKKGIPGFKKIEDNVADCIYKKFKVSCDFFEYHEDFSLSNDIIKYCDKVMLVTEARDLSMYGTREWDVKEKPLSNYKIFPMTHQESKKSFLNMFNEISRELNYIDYYNRDVVL